MDNQLFNDDLKNFHNGFENREKSMNCVECYELDLDIFNNIFKNSPRIKQNVEEYRGVINTFEKLNEDIYLSLFKASPVIKKIEDMCMEYRLNSLLVGRLLETDEFQYLRKSCSLNYFNSILAADLLGQAIAGNFKKLSEAQRNFNDQLKSYEENIMKYREEKKNLLDIQMEFEQSKSIDLHGKIVNSIENLKAVGNKISKDLENIINIIENDNLIHKSVVISYKEFLSISNTIKSWGFDDGKLTPTSYEEKIEISLKLRSLKKVREISAMSGRFKASASKLQKRKTREEGQEICGVQLGNEMHKVLPSEKLLLVNESTKKSFYKKYHQKELLTYKYKNNKAKSKGPVICCIDTSASMEGELEVWAKSVAIALLDISIKQKREFISILFSNKVYKTIEFNKHKMEPGKLYDLATFFYGSGTNFVEPLNEALNLINSAKYKYSDIVFITDGEALLDEDFVEEFNRVKEKKDFRMITVNVSDKIEEALNQINDIQILLRDLSEEEVENANNTLFMI